MSLGLDYKRLVNKLSDIPEDRSHPDPTNVVSKKHINLVQVECTALLDNLSFDEKFRVPAHIMNS